MVRKSLAETLSAQAREFLEEGKPKPAARTALPDPSPKLSPLSGIDRVLAAGFWSDEDRALIKKRLFDRYRRQLEKAGHKVTSTGLVESRTNPNTRSLDKEVRELRREVAVLADVTRTILQQVVDLGGKSPRELRNLICGIKKKKPEARKQETGKAAETVATEVTDAVTPAVADTTESSTATESVEVAAEAVETPAVETAAPTNGSSHPSEETATPAAETPTAEEQTEAPDSAEASDGATEASAETADDTAAEVEEEPVYVSRFRRPPSTDSAATPSGSLGSRLRRGQTAEKEETAEAEATPPVEKPRERIPRRDILAERGIREHKPESSSGTKVCPRCSREVSIRAPRCLSCGKQF